MKYLVISLAAAVLLTGVGHAETPVRTALRIVPITPAKTVNRVETTRVDFSPGQSMPRHKHTVPVVCFVTRGAFMVRIGDQPEASAPLGSVTYEPPGAVVEYFRNASASEPAQLGCMQLAGAADTVLNVPLP